MYRLHLPVLYFLIGVSLISRTLRGVFKSRRKVKHSFLWTLGQKDLFSSGDV